jgi:hypothetical protein
MLIFNNEIVARILQLMWKVMRLFVVGLNFMLDAGIVCMEFKPWPFFVFYLTKKSISVIV